MLTVKLINDLLYKLGLGDIEVVPEKNDNYGDFIQVFSSELDFRKLKVAIINTKYFSENIKEIGTDFVILNLKDIYKGFNFYYTIKFSAGSAFGTRIAAGTKRIDYIDSLGNDRSFFSFEMYDNYIKTFESKV